MQEICKKGIYDDDEELEVSIEFAGIPSGSIRRKGVREERNEG